MSATRQKLSEAVILLKQAEAASASSYSVLIANLNAYVSAARSVTLVMQTEFNKAPEFATWYGSKKLKEDTDFEYFNKLRVNTVHVQPFNNPQRYTTTFKGGLTIHEGTTMEIPLGRVGNDGIIELADDKPAVVSGRPIQVERSTIRTYHFADRPNEDAIELCWQYFQKLAKLVDECEQKFLLC